VSASPTLGVAVGGPYATLAALGRQVEQAGFDAVWVSETDHESIVQATVLAMGTTRVQVGTNITVAFPRSPTVTAMQAWDLAELSGDRFVVGLGSQVRRIVTDRFAAPFDRPAARMAEYVQAMRTVWNMERGERRPFRGDMYRVLRPGLMGLGSAQGRALPRVYVAAVGPLMTTAAATYADGLLGHPFTSARYLHQQVVPRVEQVLADTGRRRADFTLAQGLIVCICDDRAQAVREAKVQVGFYGTTPAYSGVFAAHGEAHLTDDLARVFADSGGDPDVLAAAVPDEVVERYAVAGTPDEVRDRLAAFSPLVDHLILGGAWYRVPAARMAENTAAIIETFRR
jgi:probable F420-dependent oxidoreductase